MFPDASVIFAALVSPVGKPVIEILGIDEPNIDSLNVAVIITTSVFLYGPAALYVISAVGGVLSTVKVSVEAVELLPAASTMNNL